MLLRNLTQLSASFIQKSPYTFEILWTYGHYALIEMKPKYPPIKDIPYYDKKVQPYLLDKYFKTKS